MEANIPLASLFNLGGPDMLVILFLVPLGFLFFLWMLIDCINNETDQGNMKLIWVLVIVFAPFGSLIYFFARKLQRSKAIR